MECAEGDGKVWGNLCNFLFAQVNEDEWQRQGLTEREEVIT